MRVAVCISGQPRSVRKSFQSILSNVIEPNNADVFIHMNYDESNNNYEGSCVSSTYSENMINVVTELYKPKHILVEKPVDYYNPNLQVPLPRLRRFMRESQNKNEEFWKRHILKHMISMFYSIYKCNDLKEKYMLEKGFVYDYVIRLRFDAKINKKIICSELNPDYIHYQLLGQPDDLISDWINVGSNLIMNVYSSIYLNLEYLNCFKYFKIHERKPNTYDPSTECSGINEHLIRDIMDLYKIPKKGWDFGCHLV
jgi:hypothetical protein